MGKKKMKFKPLFDRVLVKEAEVEEEKVSASGIVLSLENKERKLNGTVVAIGEGRLLEDSSLGKMYVKVGDTVLYEEYSGGKIDVEGEEYLIMRQEDILGII